MEDNLIMETLRQILYDVLNDDRIEITEESNFYDDYDIMSIEIFQLISEVEDRFDISIPEKEASEFQTVADLKEYIKSHTV